MVRRKCDPAFRVRQRDTAPVKAAKLTVLPMNLYCVRVNPTVIVDHVNYSEFASAPDLTTPIQSGRPVPVSLVFLLLIKVELNEPHPPEHTESHFN